MQGRRVLHAVGVGEAVKPDVGQDFQGVAVNVESGADQNRAVIGVFWKVVLV